LLSIFAPSDVLTVLIGLTEVVAAWTLVLLFQGYGDSALTKAAFGGHADVIKLLIEYGANINHQV